MIQQTRCWKGHNQRVSNRAMSYLELEIHGLVAWQGNPLNSPDVFFPEYEFEQERLTMLQVVSAIRSESNRFFLGGEATTLMT